MAIGDYNTTASSNTAIGGTSIAEGCAPSGLNNAIRQLMADLATFNTVTLPAAYQPIDADLTAIAALSSAADRFPYATGAATWTLGTVTAFGRSILDDVDAAAVRATLGLGSIATRSDITTAQIEAATLVTEAETIASNDSDTKIPTTAAVYDLVTTSTIGGTPQVVTGSRAFATTYQNTTGRPIDVTVTLVGNAAAGSAEFLIGANAGTIVAHSGTSCSGGSILSAITMRVPAGWHYRVNVTSGSLSIFYWSEHRA